jgi:membrane-bound serine protease (ClpP class)
MAPGTRTGAAHTVMVGGENVEDNVLLKKANEDLAALIRSIADHRGRNPEACEKAVFEAKAYEEQVALDSGLIDLVVPSREALLEALEGRQVRRFDGQTVTLRASGATFVESRFSFQHEFMEFLATPAVATILFLLGLLGIYVEFTTPGAILPGVVGAICLLLFALTAQVLPVSAIGVLLVLLAGVLFVLEVKVASYGMLTLAGTISLVIGAMMLIDGPIPELRVPLVVVLPTSLGIALLCAIAMRLAIRAHRGQVTTGVEGLLFEVGQVTEPLEPEGKVAVHGELWDARASAGTIPHGRRVRVVRVENMRLTVEPVEDPSSRP